MPYSTIDTGLHNAQHAFEYAIHFLDFHTSSIVSITYRDLVNILTTVQW